VEDRPAVDDGGEIIDCGPVLHRYFRS